MKVDDFDFDLPGEAIAQHPARPRDMSKLLEVRPAETPGWIDRGVLDLPALLAPGDLMVVNDTRVLASRLSGHRGEAAIEATLIKRVGPAAWAALVRSARRLKPGDALRFGPDLTAHVAEKWPDGPVVLAFDADDAALMAALDRLGSMPLPPYINRSRATAPVGKPAGIEADRADYQTLFARNPGAVAAPTAGLHFTDKLIRALDQRRIERAHVTLHVGAGTFQPVRTERAEDHRMHAEWGEVTAPAALAINAARARGARVLAVGTTSLRLIESAAGGHARVRPFAGETDIFILPGHRFRAVDLLMTNFHLPRSTLFMLVAAFSGLASMKAAYAHALHGGYRFYSYGDACLLHPALPAERRPAEQKGANG